MNITKKQAQQMLNDLDRLIASNPHYALIPKAYSDTLQRAADSLEKRIARGDFDTIGGK